MAPNKKRERNHRNHRKDRLDVDNRYSFLALMSTHTEGVMGIPEKILIWLGIEGNGGQGPGSAVRAPGEEESDLCKADRILIEDL